MSNAPRNAQPDGVAVEADGVTVAYGGQIAVVDATFALPAGRLTAVIGPNGSGKTTLLRAMSGLEQVDSGRLRVLGGAPGDRRREVAHVLQATRVNDAVPLTVAEVVRMGCYARCGTFRRFGPAEHDAVRQSMARMQIEDLADRQLRDLSGGQRQRVYVAQGLAQDARLLLLDEPITGLDLKSQDRIDTVIEEELRKGRTVVVTTHDVSSASRADHVLLLATHVVADGPPEQVLSDEHLGHAYGGLTYRTADGTMVLADPHVHEDLHGHEEH